MKPTLNKKTAGHWDKIENCREEWRKFDSITKFARGASGAYEAVKRNHWLEEMRKDFPEAMKSSGYWTLERCRKIWREFPTITDFAKNNRGVYSAIQRNGWLGEMRQDFPDALKPHGYWTLERCREAWRSCSSITEFSDKFSGAYDQVVSNQWLGEMRQDFPDALKPHGYWTLERCREAWRSCSSITEFSQKYGAAYVATCQNGWREKMREDFPEARIYGYWTLEKCREVWRSCSSISDFALNHSSPYNTARKNGWLEELRSDFPFAQKPSGYWTLEKCREVWRSCSSIFEFRTKHVDAYAQCRVKGWIQLMREDLPISTSATSNDIVYIWRTNLQVEQKSIYKIGITSKRKGRSRIETVAKKHSTEATILRLDECCNARAIESAILKIVDSVSFLKGDGATEMFSASTQEIVVILDLFDELVFQQQAAIKSH
jgi:hypothetical protein